uniref:Carbohydrate sulfotransferase n=1 Tax=Saccoglossus kowalevskii TaxID=10224 RepID=A0ABM0MZS9_SACKO|nr:PREDICTED: carbohydrate sulfotransferase 11-like [Saccoglossus kowalevskii]
MEYLDKDGPFILHSLGVDNIVRFPAMLERKGNVKLHDTIQTLPRSHTIMKSSKLTIEVWKQSQPSVAERGPGYLISGQKHTVETYNSLLSNEERINVAKDGCLRNNIKTRSTAQSVVSMEYKFIFQLIPKVGSKFWKELFDGVAQKCGKMQGVIHCANRSLTEYTRVLFVRHPLERLVSCYYDKFHILSKPSLFFENLYGDTILKIRNSDPENNHTQNEFGRLNVTFKEFVQLVISNGLNRMPKSEHWLPQYLITSICNGNLNFIGHMEHLDQDGPFVLHLLGVDNLLKFPAMHQRKGNDKLIETIKTLPKHLMEQIVEYYRLDFEILGYNRS